MLTITNYTGRFSFVTGGGIIRLFFNDGSYIDTPHMGVQKYNATMCTLQSGKNLQWDGVSIIFS